MGRVAAPYSEHESPIQPARDRQEDRLQGEPRGMAERFADTAVQKSLEVDLVLIDHQNKSIKSTYPNGILAR